jgi:hypothetical protein
MSRQVEKLTQSAVSDLLQQLLTGLKGISTEVVTEIQTEWAPRIAGLPLSDDPAGELDDIKRNMELELADAGVQAQSQLAADITNVLVAITATVLKFVAVA